MLVASFVTALLVTSAGASLSGTASAAMATCQVNPGQGASWTLADMQKASDGHALRGAIHDMGADIFYKNGIFGQYRYGGPVDIALIDSGVNPMPGLNTGNVVQGPDLSFESQSPNLAHFDSLGHGTMLASLMVGRDAANPTLSDTQTAWGLTGIAPKARVVSVKVADSQGAVDVTQVIAAIDWVVAHAHDPASASNPTGFNIRVINLSYGVVANDPWQADALSFAVEMAWRSGITVIAASGNGGAATYRFSPGLTSPAYNNDIIAVGSYDNNGTPKTFDDTTGKVLTNGGDDFMPPYTSGASRANPRIPDVVAPATHITGLHSMGANMDTEIQSACYASSDPAHYPMTVFGPNDRFVHASGTSQAAALASGAAALMISQYPGLTNDNIKHALQTTAYGAGLGVNLSGAGEINLAKDFVTTPSDFSQNYHSTTNGTSYDDARGSSILTAVPPAGTVCTPSCTLSGNTDIFGKPLSPTWQYNADIGVLNGVAESSWRNGVSATGMPYQMWLGTPLLGTGFVADSYMPKDAFGNNVLVWGGYPWAAKNWAGLAWTTDPNHYWSVTTSGVGYFSASPYPWTRFSLTGSDWTSFSLRDNEWL
ncbi:MAG TPA: S8 family serine peptidase [Acidimicrobiia bacterium]|nr:S8 family serine peptidase [Acidimicrobiia bacterium]